MLLQMVKFKITSNFYFYANPTLSRLWAGKVLSNDVTYWANNGKYVHMLFYKKINSKGWIDKIL